MKKERRQIAIAEARKPIDKHRLDEILQNHLALFQDATEEFAEKEYQLDKAKHDLEVMESMLYLQFREEARTTGEKITEGCIRAKITSNQDYMNAINAKLFAEKELNEIKHAKLLFIQRNEAIKALVQLHNSGYWAIQ